MQTHALKFQDSAMDITYKVVTVLPVNLDSISPMENAETKIVFHMELTKFVSHARLVQESMLMEIVNFPILTVSLLGTGNVMFALKDFTKALLAAVSDSLRTASLEMSLLKVHAPNVATVSQSNQTVHAVQSHKEYYSYLTVQSCKETHVKHAFQVISLKTVHAV